MSNTALDSGDARLAFRASPDTVEALAALRVKLSHQIGAKVSMSQAMRSAIVAANDMLDAAEPRRLHGTYDHRGCEQVDDVTVLCAKCHEAFHDARKLER